MKELTNQAEQGDARAQYQLGMAYYRGNGVEKIMHIIITKKNYGNE